MCGNLVYYIGPGGGAAASLSVLLKGDLLAGQDVDDRLSLAKCGSGFRNLLGRKAFVVLPVGCKAFCVLRLSRGPGGLS